MIESCIGRIGCRGLWLLVLLVPSQSYAYIDPGTGSALFYLISGLVVSAYFGIRGLYFRLLNSIFRFRFRHQSCGLAIHCEDPRYESTFIPILEEIVGQSEIDITFFTMYERGATMPSLPNGVEHKIIPPGLIGYAYLNSLEAFVLATTTPQLDVMTFRRSRRVRHYSMIQHALGEARYVRPFAYDYFDSVLCCGPILKKNIKKLESMRKTPEKLLLETGLPHYRVLIDLARQGTPREELLTVLIAPSWGPLSMFEAYGTGFVEEIARAYKVIVRPHPQMKVSQQQLYQKILRLPGVEVDTSLAPAKAMSRAHLLLSDISGIAHEFAFIHEKPVLVVDRKQTTGGLEGELLGGDSELKEQCRDFIVPVQPTELNCLVDYISDSLEGFDPAIIRAARDRVVYNFESGAKVAAKHLIQIFEMVEKDKAHERRFSLKALFQGFDFGYKSGFRNRGC